MLSSILIQFGRELSKLAVLQVFLSFNSNLAELTVTKSYVDGVSRQRQRQPPARCAAHLIASLLNC